MKHNLLLEKKLRVQEHDLYEERIRFFTNISHELRSPLMLLINPLEELITKESLNTRLGRTFNNMYRSANSLLLVRLVNAFFCEAAVDLGGRPAGCRRTILGVRRLA